MGVVKPNAPERASAPPRSLGPGGALPREGGGERLEACRARGRGRGMRRKDFSAGRDGPQSPLRRTMSAAVLAVCLAWASPSLSAPDIVFSVAGDEALTYPASIHYLPDEHTTIVSAGNPGLDLPVRGPGPFNFWVAMANMVAGAMHGDAFVLQSSDFRHFGFAPGFG